VYSFLSGLSGKPLRDQGLASFHGERHFRSSVVFSHGFSNEERLRQAANEELLGRSTRGLCQLFDELRERHVDLVSLKDGFSLESPAGRLHARILASVAEYETEVRHERVVAGQAVARRKGKKWGGSRKGWRWKVSDDQVIAIHEMRAVRKSIAHIARVTGLSRPTIYRVLR